MKRVVDTVCVYCASSPRVDEEYMSEAAEMGRLLAENGMTVVCGAGNDGLMYSLSRGALGAGGEVYGVIPQFMVDNGWVADDLTRLYIAPTMHERKKQMFDLSQGIIALPGGCGTLEELAEAITWRQLNLFHGPLIIINTRNFYAPLLQMLHHMVDEQFMTSQCARLWTVVETPAQAVDVLLAWNKTMSVDKD